MGKQTKATRRVWKAGSDQVLEEVWAGQPVWRGPKNHFSQAWASLVALQLCFGHIAQGSSHRSSSSPQRSSCQHHLWCLQPEGCLVSTCGWGCSVCVRSSKIRWTCSLTGAVLKEHAQRESKKHDGDMANKTFSQKSMPIKQ